MHISTSSLYYSALLKAFMVGNSTQVDSFVWELTFRHLRSVYQPSVAWWGGWESRSHPDLFFNLKHGCDILSVNFDLQGYLARETHPPP